jgi:hypothetical protein
VSGEGFDVALGQGTKPAPPASKGLRKTCACLVDSGFAREQGHGQEAKQRRVLHRFNRRNAPTSLTLHDQFCARRSVGLATKCQVYTFPWGNPGEAQPSSKARSTPSLERPAGERNDINNKNLFETRWFEPLNSFIQQIPHFLRKERLHAIPSELHASGRRRL